MYYSIVLQLNKKYPELFKKMSMQMEKQNSWKGYFLSSAFVVEASKN
jgi:hypothetical protein